MANSNSNPKVDVYIGKAKKWQKEMDALRNILLGCGLTEDIKWGKPCYSFNESNIAIIQGFKEYFALLFFKGVLLKDPDNILVKTGQNTHVGRQIRFADVSEITKMKSVIKAYIKAAIEIEKAGLKVSLTEKAEIKLPEELQYKLKAMPKLKAAFNALTPGRQRAYIFYFNQPKQSKTREARIEKCIQQIMDGKGLND